MQPLAETCCPVLLVKRSRKAAPLRGGAAWPLQWRTRLELQLFTSEYLFSKTASLKVVFRGLFSPTAPGLEPEDHRRDIAVFRGIEQRSGYHSVGLRDTAVELLSEMQPQCLWRATDLLRNVVLRNTDPSQHFHLPAHLLGHRKQFSRHLNILPLRRTMPGWHRLAQEGVAPFVWIK
jgi:hypothetical protein